MGKAGKKVLSPVKRAAQTWYTPPPRLDRRTAHRPHMRRVPPAAGAQRGRHNERQRGVRHGLC
eukprot:5850877-Prymnesium_polylepis.1